MKELKKQSLEIYHDKIKVFMKIEINKLTFHRKKNHEIKLILKNESPFIKNYKFIFEPKLTIVQKYLNKHLTTNFI